MSNRLIKETSPYLLQHAENPVDWYPWGEEAFRRAKEEDKPVFLSIGYSTCHWCHVMAHESFEDSKIADYLNRYFISIKVDREERPDIDAIYMAVCQAFTGSGGWPTSIFMTAEQQLLFLAGASAEFPMGHAMYLLAQLSNDEPPMKVTVAQAEDFDREKLLSVLPTDAVIRMLPASVPSEAYPCKNNRTTYYVCRQHTCFPPVNDLLDLL